MERFSDLDMYYFGQATHYDIYKKLGAHPITEKRSEEHTSELQSQR